MNIEFYSYDDEVWYRTVGGKTDVLNESCTDIINPMFDAIRENYRDSFKALEEEYGKSRPNVMYYKYVVVKRFIKCNFSRIDTTYIDIDTFGSLDKMNFEKVDCPLRGECKYEDVICMPRFTSQLSERELAVAKHWYNGVRKEDIAESMFLSVETINNHIRRIYKKLGVHSEAEFLRCVDAMRLF